MKNVLVPKQILIGAFKKKIVFCDDIVKIVTELSDTDFVYSRELIKRLHETHYGGSVYNIIRDVIKYSTK